jgi:DNA repair protein RadC
MTSFSTAQPPSGAASLHAIDDRTLIASLLGPAAAQLIEHVPVATLLDADADQLAAIGLGPAVRRRLLAAAELARRFQPALTLPEPLTQPGHVIPHLAELRTKPVEVFGVLLLDSRLTLMDPFLPVAGGALMHVAVKPREVFADAVARRAAGVVLAHNHPGGDPRPSQEDQSFTRTMLQAARLLGIRVLDHVIVTRRAYFSFSEAGLL